MFPLLIAIPSATSTFATMGEWSQTVFDELYPYVAIALGIMAGGLILLMLAQVIWRALQGFFLGIAHHMHGSAPAGTQTYLPPPQEVAHFSNDNLMRIRAKYADWE